MQINFSTQKHHEICRRCQEERSSYARHSQSPSPACVELFRRALDSTTQQEVWRCLQQIFEPLLSHWASRQRIFDVEDVVQETWLRFLRSATTTFQIQDNHYLEPTLKFIQTVLKNIIAEWLRSPQPPPVPIDLIEIMPDPATYAEQIQLRIDLERYIGEFLIRENFTEEERLLFQLKYCLRLKPREIQAELSDRFKNYDELEVALQRISRRVKSYADFRNLQQPRRKPDHRALLQLEADQDVATSADKEISVDEPCIHEESLLLDYIMGMVEAEAVAEIEASPACLQQVRALSETFGPFLHLSYRLDCPSPEQLVAYQQRTLPGTEWLVLYRHIATCPRCREDLLVLESMDVEDAATQPTLLRRIVEAFYESPLAYGLQGSWLHYRTPDVFINISSRLNRGQARSWTVRVQVRSQEGELLTTMVDSAWLESADQAADQRYQLAREEILQEASSLTFRAVAAGHYNFSMILPDQEIIIRQLAIGVDDEGG